MTPRKGKKGEAPQEVEKPTHAFIWIAKSLPSWQSAAVTCLKQLHDVSNNSTGLLLNHYHIYILQFLFYF